MNKCSGFTLLEILVSLAIFAMVTLAISKFTQIQLISWTIIEQRALGEIAAVNAIERARSRTLKKFSSRFETEEVIAGLPLSVITQINKTAIDHYLTITVDVFRSQEGSQPGPLLYQLQGARYATAAR